MTTRPLLVGLDLGTTRAKGALFDLRGRPLATAQAEYATTRPRPGWVEQHPEQWWQAARRILCALAAAVGDHGTLVGVGLVSQVNTHAFVDDALAPLRPAISWQDQRCGPIAADMDAALTDQTRAALGGAGFKVDSSYLPVRLAWLEAEHPEERGRLRWVLSPKDYVNARLTGQVGSDPLSSIGLAGAHGEYLPALEQLVPGVTAVLPPLASPLARVGAATASDAGLGTSTSVAVGTMDAWGNVYGSGLTRPGDAMEVAGTSEILGVLGDHGPGAPGVVSFAPNGDLELHAAPTQAGGDAVRWVADLLDLSVAEVTARAGRAAGEDAIVFLPHLMGERAPLWSSAPRGVFFGLSSDHGAPELCRAVLEGVACSARHVLEATIQASGSQPRAIRASGGGAVSDLWCQMKADLFGLPVHRLRVGDTGVLGAGLIAGVAAGVLQDASDGASALVGIEREFAPDARQRGRMDERYGLYREVQRALMPAFAELAELRGRHG